MKTLARLISSRVQPLTGAHPDYDPLLHLVGDARFVLLGAQTHGTHEFYRERAHITKRLIVEKRFNAVAVEADWPDAYRVNRFVRGESDDENGAEALGGFTAFPSWIWRNVDMVDLVGWLRSHNVHVGDARATDVATGPRISLGQLAREHWARDAVLIGFTTDSGTVTAASDWWASPPARVLLKPAVQDSYEAVFHRTDCRQFLLDLRQKNKVTENLRAPRLERFLSVVYRADSERECEYFKASLTDQFDAVIHIDETRAVEPLERTAEWDKGEVPETFPTGV